MKELTDKIKSLPDFYSKDGVSQEVINKAQIELSVKFSTDYIKLLTSFGILSANGHEIIGLGGSDRLNVVDVTKEERTIDPNINQDWYVIEQANIDHIMIWQNQAGEIFQTQPGYGSRRIANTLLEYIKA